MRSKSDIVVRMTTCKLVGHKWVRTAYPDSEGTSYFARCTRCHKEAHGGASGPIVPV
jgi:hypothetical protein